MPATQRQRAHARQISSSRRGALTVSSTSTATGRRSPAPVGHSTRSGRCSAGAPTTGPPTRALASATPAFALLLAQLALAHHVVVGVRALQRRRRFGTGDRVRSVGGAHASRLQAPQAGSAQPRAGDGVERRRVCEHAACGRAGRRARRSAGAHAPRRALGPRVARVPAR